MEIGEATAVQAATAKMRANLASIFAVYMDLPRTLVSRVRGASSRSEVSVDSECAQARWEVGG